MGIVVGNQQFGILLSSLIPLCHIGQAGDAFHHDPGLGVQLPDPWMVIVGKQKLSANPHQSITEPLVIVCGKTDVLVVVLGVKVRRIEVEHGVRAVILSDQLFKVAVLHNHRLQSSGGFVNSGKVLPHAVRLSTEGVQPGGIALADDLVKVCRPPDIRKDGFGVQELPDIGKVLAGIEDKGELPAQLGGMLPYTPVQIGEVGVEVIVHFKLPGGLIKEHPAPAAEHLDVPVAPPVEPADNGVPQRLLPADPR